MTCEPKGAVHAPPDQEASTAARSVVMLKRAWAVLDTLGMAVVAVIASCVFVALVVFLPLAVARELIADSRFVAGAVLLGSTGLLLALAIRDLLRRKWSVASSVLAALWFVLFVLVALS
jgi:hypothetical protein